jgi:endoglucanase
MKRIICICFSLLLFTACSTNTVTKPACNPEEEECEPVGQLDPPDPPDPPEPPPTTGSKLYVEGRQLMLDGQPKVLRGMSMYWYNGPWAQGQPGNNYYTSGTIQKLADPNDWGSNVVRAAIGCVYEKPDAALTMAKNMMDWTNNSGIYVIIDNHTHYAHRPAAATAANNFFREVSAYVKQKGYTHVIYEIYNEPVCDDDTYLTRPTETTGCAASARASWETIKTYSQTVINTIRSNDPDGVILIGTPFFSSEIQQARSNPITGQKNLMYTLHYYTGTHMNYQQRFKDAYCGNFPIFITEWGTPNADGSGAINEANNNSWMSLVEGAKVSWANWSLLQAGTGTSESSGALANSDGTVSGATSQSGTIVKRWIKELNAGRSVSGINPQISCN